MAAGVTADPLTAHIITAGGAPYVVGSADCWFFIADWIKAVTGIDPAAGIRGAFSTRTGCLRFMARHRLPDYLAFASHLLTLAAIPEIPPADMKRGDIAAAWTGADHVGVICTGRRYVGKDERGLWWGAISDARLVKAWRIV